MRKIFMLFSCLSFIVCKAQAQKHPHASVETEGNYVAKEYPTDNDFFMYCRYNRPSKKHPAVGYFVNLMTDANVIGYSTGFLYSLRTKKEVALELSIGPEFIQQIRREREAVSRKANLGLTSKISFTTKENEARARGKIHGSLDFAYSKEYGSWHEAYATVSAFRWLNLGLQHQTHSVQFGGLVQVCLPGVIRLFFTSDGKQSACGLHLYATIK